MYSVRRLQRSAPQVEVDACVQVLHEAFVHKHFIEALDSNEELVVQLIRAELSDGFREGEVWVGETENRIVGVAIWFPPGKQVFSTPEQRDASGWTALQEKLSDRCRAWWSYFLDDFYAGLSETLLGQDVRLESYHLFLLGVHPAHQGKGVAHRLFSAIDDIAIPRGIAQTVEATGKKARDVYIDVGFMSHGPLPFKYGPDEQIVRMYCLIKRPETAASNS